MAARGRVRCQAVQGVAGRGDPLGVGVGGEQPCLFGVAPKRPTRWSARRRRGGRGGRGGGRERAPRGGWGAAPLPPSRTSFFLCAPGPLLRTPPGPPLSPPPPLRLPT